MSFILFLYKTEDIADCHALLEWGTACGSTECNELHGLTSHAQKCAFCAFAI